MESGVLGRESTGDPTPDRFDDPVLRSTPLRVVAWLLPSLEVIGFALAGIVGSVWFREQLGWRVWVLVPLGAALIVIAGWWGWKARRAYEAFDATTTRAYLRASLTAKAATSSVFLVTGVILGSWLLTMAAVSLALGPFGWLGREPKDAAGEELRLAAHRLRPLLVAESILAVTAPLLTGLLMIVILDLPDDITAKYLGSAILTFAVGIVGGIALIRSAATHRGVKARRKG